MNIERLKIGLAVSVTAAAMCPVAALAQERSFDVPAQAARTAIPELAKQADVQILVSEAAVQGKRTQAVKGRMSVAEALATLLRGTGIRIVSNNGRVITLAAPAPADFSPEETVPAEEIIVTGSRIRGATSSSPVMRYESEKLRGEGVSDMRSLAAAIPQNFTGGQNPGVSPGGEARGSSNSNSATALNLRGLGPDATLTLLNGHRMAYNQTSNSIDFSSIPFAAVERVDVIPDGASAIYGSDAVAGVANIILKDGFDGLWANATIGAATEGGYITQSYSAVTGTRWATGGIMLTGNYDRNSGILADERSITATANPETSVYPELEAFGFVGVAHQDLGDRLRFSVDAVYSERDAYNQYAYTAAQPVAVSGLRRNSANWTLNVAPKLEYELGTWSIFAQALYGKTGIRTVQDLYPSGSQVIARIKNSTVAGEVGAEGALFALPGGDVRLAVGAGYRWDRHASAVGARNVRGGQGNYFGYGELSIPLVGPEQAVPAFYRLSVDAAVRYEDYPGIGDVVAPKLGVSWSPTPDFDIKGSWGRSFKAPTLYQRLVYPELTLFPGDLFGTRPAPAGQTILQVDGGNDALAPERATNLSASMVLHPRGLEGFELGITYFRLNYRNRIAIPSVSANQMLSNPNYAHLVTFSPTPDQIADLLARSPAGILDIAGSSGPFDPASVFAIMDYRYRNAFRDRVRGVDVSASYKFSLASDAVMTLHAAGTYLDTSRILVADQPAFDLAGTIFYPPHVRIRGGISLDRGPLSVNGILNYVGGVKDNRFAAVTDVGGMTSFDLAVKHRFGDERGVELQLSALNLFNAKPDRIQGTGINLPYDSANYSAIGRYVSFSITKAL
jgi:iron complex outermembrane receptor protein